MKVGKITRDYDIGQGNTKTGLNSLRARTRLNITDRIAFVVTDVDADLE